jgi:hypothetical protein
VSERLQRAKIAKFNPTFASGDQLFGTQSLHHAIEVRNAHTQNIGHYFLRERQGETGFVGAANSVEALVKLEEKMRQPLDRRPAADIDDVLGMIAASCTAIQVKANPNCGRR